MAWRKPWVWRVALAMSVAEVIIAAICLQQAGELMRDPSWHEVSQS